MSMRIILPAFLILDTTTATADHADWALAIHGGAGTISRDAMTPEREQAYHAALKRALEAGGKVLADGGTSLDAVTTAVTLLEDEPLFNAGKGAVFTSEGKNELDAAIMDGATLNAGAVAAVTRIKNPILLARAVMERSKHVLLIGDGAEAFAAEQGFSFVDPEYFFTQERWDALQRAKAADKSTGIRDSAWERRNAPRTVAATDKPFGTVGAVALDTHGNLAAATSTGGMTNKRWGRVGDVPVIGAGTYAENATAAISATGHGEYFIRGRRYAPRRAYARAGERRGGDAGAGRTRRRRWCHRGGPQGQHLATVQLIRDVPRPADRRWRALHGHLPGLTADHAVDETQLVLGGR